MLGYLTSSPSVRRANLFRTHIPLAKNGSYLWSPIDGAQTENILKNPMAHAKIEHAVSLEVLNLHETENLGPENFT